MAKITYEDIKKAFTPEDLARYNELCKQIVELAGRKSNAELWDIVAQTDSPLRKVLDEIKQIRGKYEFLNGQIIFRVWKFNPQTKQREERTW